MRTLSFLGLDAAERPRLNATSIRQLAKLGTVVRWPGLLFAAVLSLAVPPKLPLGLAVLLIWVAVYNAWGMIAISRADDTSILRVGRALTLIDTVSYFLVLFVFGGVGASTSIYAAYILLIVWMVAYDGAEGAMLCVAIFVLGMLALHAALAAYDRIVVGGVQGPATPGSASVSSETPLISPIPAVRLSRREQEVLQLVSEGYSNSMIAGRLHLSENTIKTYVENLLSRLNARNRAEAVAAASRQNLI